ncbi:PAS domain S-box protein [Salarchaeum sp. JOR-1]|uniref:PAS domain S-box protein n=1 Tax=Salarchaeum sp. JOR-1 TaxID=2599399 RepID=UPI0011983C89|nr:PAS domain S-box protein [Salarchaeum sp. JOR-1]QDX40514.1 PAS domain S-box protein [Salarchaeum sp. JOR-1]
MPSDHVLKSALSDPSDATLCVNKEGEAVFLTDDFCDQVGYETDELLADGWLTTLVPEQGQAEVRNLFDTATNEPTIESGDELTVESKDAGKKTIRWMQTVYADDGTYVVGTLQSDSRSSPEWHDPYRTLVEHFPNGIVTLFDEDFQYQIVGGQIFDELPLSPDDLEGHTLKETFPAENVTELRPLYEAAFEGEVNTTTVTLADKIFQVQVLPVYDSDGDIFAGMTVSQDITQQKEQEQELKQAQERYHALIENAPVPIFVGTADGKIIEMNEEAEALINRPQSAVIGKSQRILHPDEKAEEYEALFSTHAMNGGTRRYLPNGDQIHVETSDGDHIPVEISVSTIDNEDTKLVHGIFRDISDQVWYESTLMDLHETADVFVQADSQLEIAQSIVDTAIDILDLQLASVNLTQSDDNTLTPVAYSDDVTDILGDPPALPLNKSLAGKAYLDNETIRTGDVRSHGAVYNPNTPIRSQLIVPINGFGTIICGDTERNSFDQRDQQLLELVARTAESAFERVARTAELRDHKRELEQTSEALRQVEELDSRIRKLTQIAIQAETREELEQQVCDIFASLESFSFVWVSDLTPEGDELVPRTWAGDEQGYLDSRSFTINGSATEPAVETARSNDLTVVSNTARNVQAEPWRRDAIQRDFASGIAVPITYQNVFYGVIEIFANERDAFSDRMQAALKDWGRVMGYAITEIQRTSAILAQRGTVLEFELESKTCPLLRIAQQHECTLLFGGLRDQDGENTTVFVRLLEGSVDRLLETARDATGITSINNIQETEESSLFQIEFSEAFIGTVLAKYGIQLDRIVGETDGSVAAYVSVPPTIPVHQTVEIISTEYPNSTLRSTEERSDAMISSLECSERILSGLTERQRETVELAFHGGYFESPKQTKGADLADQMGISSSSFYNHLQVAERKILKNLLGSPPKPD